MYQAGTYLGENQHNINLNAAMVLEEHQLMHVLDYFPDPFIVGYSPPHSPTTNTTSSSSLVSGESGNLN